MRTAIPLGAVAEFVAQLGVALDDLSAVEIRPGRVTVTEYRRDEDGARFAVGDRAATTVTDIRIDRNS